MPTLILKRNGGSTKRAFFKRSARLSENEVIARNLEYATEFSRYLVEHPAFAEKISANAQIFFMSEIDPALCEANRRLIEMENRLSKSAPIVVIRFDKLAPAQSRLIRPRVERQFVVSVNH